MKNTLKTCTKCRQIKLITAFGTDKTNKSGLQSWCQSCKAVWARQNYQTDKGKAAHKKAHKKWYQATKGKTNRERQADLLNAAQEVLSVFQEYGKTLRFDDSIENALSKLNIAIRELE
jgi:hypothetical protein